MDPTSPEWTEAHQQTSEPDYGYPFACESCGQQDHPEMLPGCEVTALDRIVELESQLAKLLDGAEVQQQAIATRDENLAESERRGLGAQQDFIASENVRRDAEARITELESQLAAAQWSTPCESCGAEIVGGSAEDNECMGCDVDGHRLVVCQSCVDVHGHIDRGRHDVGDPAAAVESLREQLTAGGAKLRIAEMTIDYANNEGAEMAEEYQQKLTTHVATIAELQEAIAFAHGRLESDSTGCPPPEEMAASLRRLADERAGWVEAAVEHNKQCLQLNPELRAATIAEQAGEIERLRGAVAELISAMADYEMDVDEGPAPSKHRSMMKRARAALEATDE